MRFGQDSYSVNNIIQLKNNVGDYFKQQNHEENSSVTNDRVLGGILSSTSYPWLACGPRLQILHPKSGTKIAAWCFRAQHDFNTAVTCVCDLPSPRGRAPFLVVGLECEITGGMICVFDAGSCKVVRAIQIDEKVTSLEVVSSGCDSGLPGVLRALDGVIAVGTSKGKILLIDLCRQLCEEAINNNGNELIRDEINPCHLTHLSFEDLKNLENHKQMSLSKGDHLCIQLNENSTSSVHFSLFGPNGDLRLRANMSEVVISSLHFSAALGSLLIGFNFGAWQLYHLVATPYPLLVYTSPMYEDCVPVAHFGVQEPCDDPRAFCYVWVVYSVQESDIVDSERDTAMAVMYALTYDSKEYLEGYGVIYQDLQACSVRLQIELASIIPGTGKNTAARCTSLRSYSRQPSPEAPEERLALCCLVWVCWDSSSPGSFETYLALFDLNQWYKEQMPSHPRGNIERYMAVVNVTEMLANYGDGKMASEELLDLRLDSTSLIPFTTPCRLEEHYYPFSLAFKAAAISPQRICLLQSAGVQRHFFTQLEFAGPLCLLQPSELYHRCIALGLCPQHCEIVGSPTVKQQREIVLGVALEHQLIRWLCRCALDWSNGAQSTAGCTIDSLLDWAWQRANSLKFNCDKICVPLFDHSGERLDQNALQQLNHAVCQLKHLATLFDTVLTHCYMHFTQEDVDDIRYQHSFLSMTATYLEVLQWLLNVGLLPEAPLAMYPLSDHLERVSAPYPSESLSRFYTSRRTEFPRNEQSEDESRYHQMDSLLFIDQLIARECGGEKLAAEWRCDGGDGWYPPPSLQALLRTYLVEDIEMEYKHCLVIYVFLDLAMTLDQSRYKSIITHLIKFPAVFKLSPSIIKMTQAFWQLDHGDFSTAMAQLLDPAVASEDFKLWHHRTVMKALLLQGQHQHALLYYQVRKPPVTSIQDICIVITLLIVNDLLQEAFHFQRQYRSEYNEKEILKHFFSVNDKMHHLPDILYLSLSSSEEAAFVSYLRSHPTDSNQNLLVIYYLQRDRYEEAFRINDSLNARYLQQGEKQGLLGQQERNFRNVMVEGFKKTLPDVTQLLLDLIEKEKKNFGEITWQNLDRPLPMSVYVHGAKEKVKYKSTLIQASLFKAGENLSKRYLDDNSEISLISTPKAQLMSEGKETPLIYATEMQPSINDDLENEATPVKRMRLNPRPSINTSIKNKSQISFGQSPLSLLGTPIVKRKSYRGDQSTESSVIGTPNSILKIRSFIRNCKSPDVGSIQDSRGNSTTPEMLDEDMPNNEINETKSLMNIITPQRVRSPLGLSPRRPIQRTPRPAVHFEDFRPNSRTSDKSSHSDSSINKQLEIQIEVHREQTPEAVATSGSQDNSRSLEDIFYSPNSSSSDYVNSQENSININEKEDINNDSRINRKRKAPESALKSRRSYKNPIDNASPIELQKSTPICKEKTPRSVPKVGGRRSLSRQVLEQNTLTKALNLTNLPKMQTRLSLAKVNQEKIEVSYSKTVTSIVKNTSDTVDEEKCDKSTFEMKNVFTTEKKSHSDEQIIKHIHNEVTSKSTLKKITKLLDVNDEPILSPSSDVEDSFCESQQFSKKSDTNETICEDEFVSVEDSSNSQLDDQQKDSILSETNKVNIEEKQSETSEESNSSEPKNLDIEADVHEENSKNIEIEQTHYLIPSSEEISDAGTEEEEKISNQDEEVISDEEYEIEGKYKEECSEESKETETESENSSRSSDVIEIKSTDEESMPELKMDSSDEIMKNKEAESESEEDKENIIEEENEIEGIIEENKDIVAENEIVEEVIELVKQIEDNEIKNVQLEPETIQTESVIEISDEIKVNKNIETEIIQGDESIDFPEDIRLEIEECIQDEEMNEAVIEECKEINQAVVEQCNEEINQAVVEQCEEINQAIVEQCEEINQAVVEECNEEINQKIVEECNEAAIEESIKIIKKSPERGASQDCLEVMSFIAPEEQIQNKTDFLCDENLAKHEPTQVLHANAIEEESIAPRSKRITRSNSKQQQEQIIEEISKSTKTVRRRSASVDVEIQPKENLKSTRASTRKRSTSVDIDLTEKTKPARTRSASVDTKILPTQIILEKEVKKASRRKSTESDDAPKRTTRASSVINLPPIKEEETKRTTRASSLEPKLSSQKKSQELKQILAPVEEEIKASQDPKISPSRRGKKRSVQENVPTIEDSPEKIKDYTETHRLTRRQKVMMQTKSLEMQQIKKLQKETRPKITTKENIEESSDIDRSISPSTTSTSIQSTDFGTPRRRSSRRISANTLDTSGSSIITPGTPTRRSRRLSKDTLDDASSVQSVPVVRLERIELEEAIRHRSLSPNAFKETVPSPRGKRKSSRKSVLPLQTDLSKITEENTLDEPTDQTTKPKKSRPKKITKEDPQSTQRC